MGTRPRHRHQRGQVLAITALAAAVLIGAAALAVDLSMQTANRRQVQNVTDVAALAGARDLFSSSASITTGDQTNAVSDALLTVQRQMGWPDAWLAGTQSCPGFPPANFTTYGLTGQCQQVVYGAYTVTVSTPPMSPRSLADMDPHNLQVDMKQSSQNNLAGIIGFATSQQGGHAVAGHMAGGTTINFALFSNTYVDGGNANEIVYGNVYANRKVRPQSSSGGGGGSATFCASNTAGNDDGYIILGASQTAASGGQPSDTHAPAIGASTSCGSVPASPVFQLGAGMRQSPPACPTIAGLPDTLTYNSTVGACVTLPITPPLLVSPPLSGHVVQIHSPCQGNANGGNHPSCWTSSVVAGLYVISHNSLCDPPACYDLKISASMSLSNVSFWLKAGASMSVNMGGNGGTVTDSGPYDAGTGQAGDGKYVVYGEGDSRLYIVGSNNTVTFNTGSIDMPGGSVIGQASTAALYLNGGQAVVNTWQVSTGAQPNPQITGNPAFNAVSQETLRLLE